MLNQMRYLQKLHGLLYIPVMLLQGCLALLCGHSMDCLLHLGKMTNHLAVCSYGYSQLANQNHPTGFPSLPLGYCMTRPHADTENNSLGFFFPE